MAFIERFIKLSFGLVIVAGAMLLVPHQARSAEIDCDDINHRLTILTMDYFTNGVENSQSQNAEAIYQQIQKVIFSEVGESHPCFNIAAINGYIQTAMSFGQVLNSNDSGSSPTTPLLNALFSNSVFIPLTDQKRKEMGGAWIQTDQSGDYLIASGYDCAKTQIYIDPRLRPLDLIVTMYHEMDHLYRDKSLPAPPKDGSMDWQRYNFEDEAEAVSTSTAYFIQLSLFKKIKLTNDFSFFSPKGPVTKFAKKTRALPMDAAQGLLSQPDFNRVIWSAYFDGTPMPKDLSVDSNLPTTRTLMWNYETHAEISTPVFDVQRKADILSKLVKYPTPSVSCQAYLESIQQTPIKNYLGTKLSNGTVHPCVHFKGTL